MDSMSLELSDTRLTSAVIVLFLYLVVRCKIVYSSGCWFSHLSVSFTGFYKNPQTEALLQFLELEYVLNKMPESREPAAGTASFVSGCKCSSSIWPEKLFSLVIYDALSVFNW